MILVLATARNYIPLTKLQYCIEKLILCYITYVVLQISFSLCTALYKYNTIPRGPPRLTGRPGLCAGRRGSDWCTQSVS